MPKEELLDEVGIPLTPGAAQVRDPRPDDAQGGAAQGEGHAAPRRTGRLRRARAQVVVPEVDVCPLDELPPGRSKIVHAGLRLGACVYNLDGELYAIEDRCSHDDGPLCEGDCRRGEDVRHLPAPRRELRHPHRPGADAARLRAGRDVPGPRRGRDDQGRRASSPLMLDDRVRAVLAPARGRGRRRARAAGCPRAQRSRQVAPTTGRFLFALVAPQPGCEVLEIGGSRGYSTIWLAAGVRLLGGRVLSLEADPAKCEAWRRNVAEAGLEEWAELVEGDALETLPRSRTSSTSSSSTPRRTTTSGCSRLARGKLEPGALVVADNVLSHADTLARVLAPPARPTRRSRASPSRSTAVSSCPSS